MGSFRSLLHIHSFRLGWHTKSTSNRKLQQRWRRKEEIEWNSTPGFKVENIFKIPWYSQSIYVLGLRLLCPMDTRYFRAMHQSRRKQLGLQSFGWCRGNMDRYRNNFFLCVHDGCFSLYFINGIKKRILQLSLFRHKQVSEGLHYLCESQPDLVLFQLCLNDCSSSPYLWYGYWSCRHQIRRQKRILRTPNVLDLGHPYLPILL